MELQLRVEEICNEKLRCGAAESLRRLISPRAPSRCCSGSMRTFKSYLVKVNASRSSATAHNELQTTHRTHRSFIPTSSAAASQFRIAPRLPQPKHLMTAPALASESKPGNRTSCLPDREGPCLLRQALTRSPFCNPLRRSFAFHAHPTLQSTGPCF